MSAGRARSPLTSMPGADRGTCSCMSTLCVVVFRCSTAHSCFPWTGERYWISGAATERGCSSLCNGGRIRGTRALFADCDVELAPVLLAPPLGRLIAGWSRPLAELLHSIPFLRTHYAGLIRKRTGEREKAT